MKKRNQGFSLFTVIVAVSFIGILGMLMLYVAVSNFHMKITDLKGKDSFYTAERALEEIRTGLQEDVGEAMSTAYIRVLETYSEKKSTAGETLDAVRQQEFKKQFIVELGKRVSSANPGEYDPQELEENYLDYKASPEFDDKAETLIITTREGTDPVLQKDVQDGVRLKNLKVIYVEPKGRASIIETDIRLGIPEVRFPTPSTLPDLMNMIVVADGGIVCTAENNTSITSIQGSAYAGLIKDRDETVPLLKNISDLSIDVQPGASLDVSLGDKLVCQGEINVGTGSRFTSAGEVTLWAQGINLASAKVELLGKTCIADDLTVNAGTGAAGDVTISGEYYGFGSAECFDKIYENTNKNFSYSDNKNATDLSSAIVINGKNTTLDLSGVQKIMPAGKNYLATSRVPSGKQYSNESNVMTGESLTVKGTQLAYLLPSSLIGDGTATNPMSFDTYAKLEDEGKLAFQQTIPVDAWGGKTLSEIGVDEANPVQKVFYNLNETGGSGGYVYFYLNFKNDEAAAAFMQMYYRNNPKIKEKMDEYLSFYFGEDAGISVKNPRAYLRYITNGNVLSYDGGEQSGGLNNATDARLSEELIKELINYHNMWFALNRKMINSYDLLFETVKDAEGEPHDETDKNRSVFDNLVNEKLLSRFIEDKIKETNSDSEEVDVEAKKYTFTAEKDDNLKAVFINNGSEKNPSYPEGTGMSFVITKDMAENERLRLVVATGDVEIAENAQFQGIIMAKGKLTLHSGAKLISAPLEAARVFQAINVDQEDFSPKNFFWEGDRYVLGNSTNIGTENPGGRTEDNYDLADCVTYENWEKK